MDSSHLGRTQWPRFADMIARSTGHRVTLDLSARDDARPMRHDI
jgi:hypothetical protein